MKPFSTAVCERIGSYVYVLIDPRDRAIFYIGKGTSNRWHAHVYGALTNEDPSDRLDMIREIHCAGQEVGVFILRHGMDHEQALAVESAAIDLLGLSSLKNKVRGHHAAAQGRKTLDEITQHYDAQEVIIEEPTILLALNKKYPLATTEKQLYDFTRSSWRVGVQKRALLRYAFTTYNGIIREVYAIERWVQNGHKWEFVGRVAEKEVRDKYLHQSARRYPPNPRNGMSYSF